MNTKVKHICSHCGSDHVVHDSISEWNVELQDYVLITCFDSASCENCDGECRVSVVPLEEAGE